MLATGPRVLNPAPYSPCWYTSACHGSQGPESCTLQPLLVHQCLPRVPGSRILHPTAPAGTPVPATGPRALNPAPYSPCWYTSACHVSQGPESCTLQPLLVHQCLPRVPGSRILHPTAPAGTPVPATGPRTLNPAPYSPCWYTSACHGSQGPESCTLQPLLVHQCLPRVPGS